MSIERSITPERVKELLGYHPETGALFWKARSSTEFRTQAYADSWNRQNAGKPALTPSDRHGYLRGRICGHECKAHRVAWAIFHGAWPEGVIDHINGDPSDNRISNLRDVPRYLNQRNARLRKDNKTGISGIRRKSPKKSGAAWLFVNAEKSATIPQKSFRCLGQAVRHRNAVLRSLGYQPDHGIRGFEASESMPQCFAGKAGAL